MKSVHMQLGAARMQADIAGAWRHRRFLTHLRHSSLEVSAAQIDPLPHFAGRGFLF
jgi:hypothetical protein